ncbi:MAG: PHP domain-containing protein, partial [Jiangellaceae bacterium]
MIMGVRRRLTQDDQAASPYLELPFEVAAGVGSLEVRLAYDRSSGVVDLGCWSPSGFRGWSGGARSRFTITATAATPGYLPGDLEPGQWTVLLGLHRIPAAGLDVEVDIELPASAPPDG